MPTDNNTSASTVTSNPPATANTVAAKAADDAVMGYPRLAARMAALPTAAMFRGFGALNIRNLPYYQSELSWLEEELKEMEAADFRDDRGERKIDGEDFGEMSQLDIVLRIREVLAAYNKALIQHSKILELGDPDAFDLRHIQNFLATNEMGPLCLCGSDCWIWGKFDHPKSYADDLIALRQRENTDSFSRWMGARAMKIIKLFGCARWVKVDPKVGGRALYDNKIFKVTFWITSIIASAVPIMSIMALNYIKSREIRLGVIALFNVLLSVLLTIFTDAKRTDVFAVTAAFAAVQVVFVSGDKEID